MTAREHVLVALAELHRAMSLRELAAFTRISPSTAMRVVNGLAAEGVVTRQTRAAGTVIEVVPARRRWLARYRDAQPLTADQQLDWLSERDVELFVIRPGDIKALGVRRPVPTFVVTTKRWASALSIPAPVVLLEHPHSLRRDALTDIELLVALLKLDPAAAAEAHTAISRRPDPRRYRRRRLLKRIREEHLQKVAAGAGIALDARRTRPA